jgi:hypothetical protein
MKNNGVVEPGVYVEAANANGAITLGKLNFADDGSVLVANSVKIGRGASVANVSSNVFNGGPGAVVRYMSRLAPPLPLALDVTARTPANCSGPAVTVATGGTLTLPSGVYGDVRLANSATLILGPGSYRFCSFTAGRTSTVEFQGPVASQVAIAGNLKIGNSSSFGPTAGTPPPTIEVGGRWPRYSRSSVPRRRALVSTAT